MPSMHGMSSSIGPIGMSTGLAPRFTASRKPCCASLHAEGHGVGAGAVLAAEIGGLAVRLHVEDEIDVVLLVTHHVLGAVPGRRR